MALCKINGLFRLTRDAELKYTQDGKAILKIGVACSEKFGDKETQLFLDATAFGKPAEILSQHAGTKGTQIFLSGKLQTDMWEKEGVKQSKISMIIESFDFVSGQSKSDNQQAPQYQQYQRTDYQPRQEAKRVMPTGTLPIIDIDDSEIPFNRG